MGAPFFMRGGKMVRIAGETNSALARHQKLYQLRMSSVKLYLGRSDLLE